MTVAKNESAIATMKGVLDEARIDVKNIGDALVETDKTVFEQGIRMGELAKSQTIISAKQELTGRKLDDLNRKLSDEFITDLKNYIKMWKGNGVPGYDEKQREHSRKIEAIEVRNAKAEKEKRESAKTMASEKRVSARKLRNGAILVAVGALVNEAFSIFEWLLTLAGVK